MAVKLRLRRMGKKKQPIYKVVAADVRSPRDGKFLEVVGLYNPLTDPHTIEIKEDRVLYWLDNGAQPTNTVKSLLRQKGITLKRELVKKGLDAEKVEAEMENWRKLKEASSKKKSVKKKSKKQAAEEKSEETIVEKPTETVTDEKPTETVTDEKPAETVAEEKPAETVVEDKPVETVVEEKSEETVVEKVDSKEESKPEEKAITEEGTTEVKGAASEENEAKKE